MEKREKIIVIATVIIAIYGAVDFLFLSKKNDKKTQPLTQASSEIISTVTAQLARQPQEKNNNIKQLVDQITLPWPENQFFNESSKTLMDTDKEAIETNEISSQFNPDMFVYTGFLQMGANRMAIINGSDYKKGDDVKGFTLTDISPQLIKMVLEGIPFEIPIKPLNQP